MLRFLCLRDKVDNDAFDQGRKYSSNVNCFNSLPCDSNRSSASSSKFFFFFFNVPKASKSARVITNHQPCSFSLAWAPTHPHLLPANNLEQLPHLPRECALSMTISKILCLNYSKVSMFTTYRMAMSSMPSLNIGQKWAHPLEFLLH